MGFFKVRGNSVVFKPTNIRIEVGAGSPSGLVRPIGSIYLRSNGGQDTAVYMKTGSSSSNWTPIALSNPVVSSIQATSVAGLTMTGSFVYDADTTQTLANSGALALTVGKAFFKVAGSGGAVTGCTIPDGTTSGQLIYVQGTHDTNTVQFATNGATNIATANGTTTRTLGNCDTLSLIWNGSKWCETAAMTNNL